MNSSNSDKLEKMKGQIEKMSVQQQLEILKILHEHNDVKLNENKSGVYINLSFLPEPVMKKVEDYLKYVNDQEKSLGDSESRKEDVKHTYFEGAL